MADAAVPVFLLFVVHLRSKSGEARRGAAAGPGGGAQRPVPGRVRAQSDRMVCIGNVRRSRDRLGLLVLFDNWLWPERGESLLQESLAGSVVRIHTRLIHASGFYLGEKATTRPHV